MSPGLWSLSAMRAGYAGDRASDFFGSAGVRGVDFDDNFVRAVASVTGGLIDAERKFPADRRGYVFDSADQEGLRDVGVADSGDERAAAGFVERKDAKKILEAPGEAVGAVVGFSVGVAEFALRGDDGVLTGFERDCCVGPYFCAIESEGFGEDFFCGGCGGGFCGLRGGGRRELLRFGNSVFADELGVKRRGGTKS